MQYLQFEDRMFRYRYNKWLQAFWQYFGGKMSIFRSLLISLAWSYLSLLAELRILIKWEKQLTKYIVIENNFKGLSKS